MPGREENSFRKPFSGRSGQELNERLLPLANLSRKDVYFTNTVKCWFPDGLDYNKKADREIIETCARHHLPAEFAQVKPDAAPHVPHVAVAARPAVILAHQTPYLRVRVKPSLYSRFAALL